MSTPMAVQRRCQASYVDRMLGVLALLVTIPAVRRLRLGALINVVRLLKRCCWRTATVEQAAVAVEAVRASSLSFLLVPAQVAGLEISLAVLLCLAVRGRAVGWCLGVTNTPYAAHVWIAVEGRPVGEPPNGETVYRQLLII